VPHKKTLNWYEANLSVQERKVRGHFSTPLSLVNYMLDACGYTADADLSHLRVLDPACGSGNFLVGAAQRILASGKQRETSSPQLLASLQRDLWGFDPDPVACFLAEMQVRTLLIEQGLAQRKLHLHIHQADGLALPWEQAQRESVDLFLANPPYLAAKNADLSGYRPTQQGVGQGDSYLFFLRLALQVVRPGGWIGLVLPDPVLARANATHERQCLLEETTVHHLWHLSHVFPAYVGAVVIIAQKRPPTRIHQIAWVREKWRKYDDKTVHTNHALSTSCIAQSLLYAQPSAELRYLLGTEQGTLIERLHTYMAEDNVYPAITPLSRFVSIRRGEELGKKSKLLVDTLPGKQGWHPLLLGGVEVRPYATPQGQSWIAEKSIEKPLERYLAPKLLVVKSTNILQAALDVQGHVVLQTLYLLELKEYVGMQWQENMTEPMQSENMTEPMQGENMTEPMQSENMTEPMQSENMTEPMQSENMTEPMQGENMTEPMAESMTGASPVTTILSPHSGETVYSSDRACPCHASTSPCHASNCSYHASNCSYHASHHVSPDSLDTLYYLLALLNSRLLQRYVYVLHTAYKLVQPQIEQHVLAHLPIPVVAPEMRHEIVARAKHIMLACSEASSVVELEQQINLLREEQERAICALYEHALHL